MCSVLTNLMTSLEFQPIRCATTVFQFGRPRDVYVATRIILLSSTAAGSATSGYVAATNAPAKVRPELVETWSGLGNTPSLFQTVVLIDAACNHKSFYIIHLIFPYFKSFSDCITVFFPCMEITLIFCLCNYSLCRRGNNHVDVHFRRIVPYFFLSKFGKDPIREGRNGQKGVYFPLESASFFFDK